MAAGASSSPTDAPVRALVVSWPVVEAAHLVISFSSRRRMLAESD